MRKRERNFNRGCPATNWDTMKAAVCCFCWRLDSWSSRPTTSDAHFDRMFDDAKSEVDARLASKSKGYTRS